MKKKDISIIYIFGPSRLWNDYLCGKPVSWLKIGKTTGVDGEDKWLCAAKRVNGTRHTGIPEPSRLYEVYAYPFQNGDYDDDFRKILTDDIYSVANSKTNNKLISDPYEIKAGDEFVYEVNRNQIANARAKYEHGLILSAFSKGNTADSELMNMVLANQISPFDEEEVDATNSPRHSGTKVPDPLMKKLYESLPENIKKITTLNNGEKYHYVIIKSIRSGFWYSAAYSSRSRQISVAYETYGGDKSRDEIRKIGYDNSSLLIEEQQGTKNTNKWAWRAINSLDLTEDEIINWYKETIGLMLSTFEPK